MNTSLRPSFLALLVVTLGVGAASASACSDAVTSGDGLDVVEPVGSPDTTIEPEVEAPVDTSGPDVVDVAPEVSPEPEVSDAPVSWDADGGADDLWEDIEEGPIPGSLGAPCTSSDSCFSGWCMPSQDGMVCSKGCVESCPDGWSCQSITGPTGAPAFVCVQPMALLCQPCVEHKDCNQAIAAGTNLCVSHGDEGSFCGVICDDDAGCLEGYVCDAVPSPGGGTSGQCVPVDGGLCTCSGIGIQLGLQTGCAQTNDIGSCHGSRGCEPEGLTSCDAMDASLEVCNAVDDNCDGETDEGTAGLACEVESGAGTCPGFEVCSQGQMVCQGSPPIDEICNGVDDDCDGTLDEGFFDSEGDGLPDCSDLDDDNDGTEDVFDCQPLDPAVSPDLPEICNGFDDDCDGEVDEKNAEGCETYWQDIDADGHGSMAAPSRCLCAPDLQTFYTVGDAEGEPSDCADLFPNIKPNAPETCDGADEDCDTLVDEGFLDSDGDDKPDCTDDDDDGDGTPDIVDCAPNDPSIYIDAPEFCNDIDDDCDGVTDEEDALGCVNYYQDVDSDDHGSWTVAPRCLCGPDQGTLYTALEAGDCDDLNAEIFFGAIEKCNGIDDTCDGFTDEWFEDVDVDWIADCVDPDDDNDGVDDLLDCAPYDPTKTPGAPELCNGVDDNCVDGIDEPGSEGCVDYWLDVDGDEMGSDIYPSKCLCEADLVNHYTADQAGDCNDANPDAYEGALEVCNVIDDDCDGAIDEGVSSPCNDCSTVCVLQLGAQGLISFDLAVGTGVGVELLPDGALTLQAPPGEGTYTHALSGWEDAPTLWDRLWLEVEVPATGASVNVRYRTAASENELDVAIWQGPFGPFTTGLLPVEINQVAAALQVELTLISTDINANPILRDISFIAWKQ